MSEEKGRKKFTFEKRTIYQWEQSLDSISIFIQCPQLPKEIKLSSAFDIKIKAHFVSVGFKGNPPYLTHETQGVVDCDESVWYMSENPENKDKKQIVIELQKAQKGVRWGCVFKGHGNLNPLQEEELKKKLMLERFQQENPGFDFSGADFNGKVPDARNFMGGIKYD